MHSISGETVHRGQVSLNCTLEFTIRGEEEGTVGRSGKRWIGDLKSAHNIIYMSKLCNLPCFSPWFHTERLQNSTLSTVFLDNLHAWNLNGWKLGQVRFSFFRVPVYESSIIPGNLFCYNSVSLQRSLKVTIPSTNQWLILLSWRN